MGTVAAAARQAGCVGRAGGAIANPNVIVLTAGTQLRQHFGAARPNQLGDFKSVNGGERLVKCDIFYSKTACQEWRR